MLSEEAKALPWAERRHWSRYWLVDPLDGTREFVKRNGEFTVNIALIDDHRSVLGVVLAPVTGELYVAAHGQERVAAGARWRRVATPRTRPLGNPPRAAGSRSHGGAQGSLLERLVGSDYGWYHFGSSLKFCLIARGEADIYLRLGLTSEWDTAAAQCVLEEAGGAVLDFAGRPFRYHRGESLLNPDVAIGDATIDWAARLSRSEE
ncbi:3'(2'),5'-bisphosphate nucleotidase CysQ OS=Rhodanobacter lindaniclasticus OX=75310 GN=cysQ PE=3 SV=1 [Rhodanobacter lindaniclasticus]